MKDLLTFLEFVPSEYKTGPWHPFAHLILVGVSIWLLLSSQAAEASYLELIASGGAGASTSFPYAGACGIYMIVVAIILFNSMGIWPIVSYTVTSWNILSLRLICCAIASHTQNSYIALLARTLRFPSLVGAFITVSIWWTLLVPTIYLLLGKEPARQRGFLWFNFSPMLLNLHMINLPIALTDFAYSAAPFVFFDLWVGLVIVFFYILFYLNVLDRIGLHFYILFTPRSAACIVTYPLILWIYYSVYTMANLWLTGASTHLARR